MDKIKIFLLSKKHRIDSSRFSSVLHTPVYKLTQPSLFCLTFADVIFVFPLLVTVTSGYLLCDVSRIVMACFAVVADLAVVHATSLQTYQLIPRRSVFRAVLSSKLLQPDTNIHSIANMKLVVVVWYLFNTIPDQRFRLVFD